MKLLEENTGKASLQHYKKIYTMHKYIRELEYKTATDEIVPDSVFFLLDEERDILLGAVHIRHYLNKALSEWSGHIGIGIRPGERRKGYATQMLALIIKRAAELGMDRLQLSVERSNEPSVKTIIKNGGRYERSFTFEGEEADVYIIFVNESQDKL